MICSKCNTEGVLNTVLGKDFYYCRTCKDEIRLEPTFQPLQRELDWAFDALQLLKQPGSGTPTNINGVHVGPGYRPAWPTPPVPTPAPSPSPFSNYTSHNWSPTLIASCFTCGITSIKFKNFGSPSCSEHAAIKAINQSLMGKGSGSHDWNAQLDTCMGCKITSREYSALGMPLCAANPRGGLLACTHLGLIGKLRSTKKKCPNCHYAV